jgi:hypothetical protein
MKIGTLRGQSPQLAGTSVGASKRPVGELDGKAPVEPSLEKLLEVPPIMPRIAFYKEF